MARLKNLTDRGLETERHLRDVFMSLVVEKGYVRVSVYDITERAGIDRTTFYLHFKDKDDLFEKSQRWLVDDLIGLRSTGAGRFPGIAVTFEHMARNAETYLAIFRSEVAASRAGTLQEYIVQVMAPILERQLREKGIRSDVLIEPVANYLAGALRGVAQWWLEAGMPRGAEDMSDLFIGLVLRGLASLKNDRAAAPSARRTPRRG